MCYSTTMYPKLYSPAGDWECARAAVAAGADGVYFGLPRFNARMRAKNFQEEDLPALCEYLRNHGVESVAALNVLIFPDLASGNIAFKLVSILGGSYAFGQILTGLSRPAAEISRGSSAHDVFGAAAIVGGQAIDHNLLYGK